MPARARPDLPFHGSRLVNYPPSRPTIDRPISTTTRARGWIRARHSPARERYLGEDVDAIASVLVLVRDDRPTERTNDRTNDRTNETTD